MNLISTKINTAVSSTVATDVSAIPEIEIQMIEPGRIANLAELLERRRGHLDGLEGMAKDMVKNGFSKDKPLMGHWTAVDGQIEQVKIIDGALRLQAAIMAMKMGASFSKVPVYIDNNTRSN